MYDPKYDQNLCNIKSPYGIISLKVISGHATSKMTHIGVIAKFSRHGDVNLNVLKVTSLMILPSNILKN